MGRHRIVARGVVGRATVGWPAGLTTAVMPGKGKRMVNRAENLPEPPSLRRGGGLRRMPELLGRLLDPAARRRGLAEARLLTDWATVIGPHLAARCQPVKLARDAGGRGGVLMLHVSGPAALELQHSQPQVIERINGYFGYPAVGRLRLIQAPRRPPVKPPRRCPIRSLDATECAEIDRLVQPIADAELRAALTRLGRTLRSSRGGQVPA